MRLLIFLLALAACGQPSSVTNDWSGAVTQLSPEYEIFREGEARMSVHAARIILDGRDRWGVMTSVRRTGPNGPRVRWMKSGETALAYTRLDRLHTHCIDRCQRAETGFITLSAEAFVIAARTGLPLRVMGKRGRYEGHVPSRAFADVLARGTSE